MHKANYCDYGHIKWQYQEHLPGALIDAKHFECYTVRMMTLGRKIEMLRKDRGWTQIQLAEMLGMTGHHLSRWENDKIRPRAKMLEKLAEILGLPVDELTSAPKTLTPKSVSNDPELAVLLAEVDELDEEQKGVLKHVLRSMLTCKQMEMLIANSHLKRAS